MIRNAVLLLALALAYPALAQTAPPAVPNPAASNPAVAKPSPAKPVAKKPPKPAPPKADDAAQHGPCIGVIPRIGERFTVKRVGLTVFGNELKEVPIESWGLNDVVVARVRAAADKRFVVRRIAYAANAFEPYDHPHLFHDPENDLKGVVQTVAGAAGAGGCERYVAVVESGKQIVGTNQGVFGIGILNRGLTNPGTTMLFALTTIFVFDGHTFDVLKKGNSERAEDRIVPDRFVNDLLRSGPIHGPTRELKDFAWPPTPDAVMGLREPTRALLAESFDATLPELLAQPGE